MASTLSAPRRKMDRRAVALVLTVVAITAGGWGVQRLSSRDAAPESHAASGPAARAPRDAREREVHVRFTQAVTMLHARQYDHAVAALHRVLELAPQMPEAHVNMGFALLGLKRAGAARDFFEAAAQLNPMQANAYYGNAMALEELGDLPGAVGAMRTYLHLARQEDERHLARARAALWEWETQLDARRAKRSAAGETKPATETRPAPETKSATETRPAAGTQPATETKPAAGTRPAVGAAKP